MFRALRVATSHLVQGKASANNPMVSSSLSPIPRLVRTLEIWVIYLAIYNHSELRLAFPVDASSMSALMSMPLHKMYSVQYMLDPL